MGEKRALLLTSLTIITLALGRKSLRGDVDEISEQERVGRSASAVVDDSVLVSISVRQRPAVYRHRLEAVGSGAEKVLAPRSVVGRVRHGAQARSRPLRTHQRQRVHRYT